MARFDQVGITESATGVTFQFQITNVFSNPIDLQVRLPSTLFIFEEAGVTYSSFTSNTAAVSSVQKGPLNPGSTITIPFELPYGDSPYNLNPSPGAHSAGFYIYWKTAKNPTWRTTTTTPPDQRQFQTVYFNVPAPPEEPEEETPANPEDGFEIRSVQGFPINISAGQNFNASVTVSGVNNFQVSPGSSLPPNAKVTVTTNRLQGTSTLSLSGTSTVADAGTWSIQAEGTGINTGLTRYTGSYQIKVSADISWNTDTLDTMYVGKAYSQILDATNAATYELSGSPNVLGNFSINGNELSGTPGQDDSTKVMGDNYSFTITARNRIDSSSKIFSGIKLRFPGKRFDADNNPQEIKTAQRYTNAGWVPIETSVRRYSLESADQVTIVKTLDNDGSPTSSISLLNSGVATGDVILVFSVDGTPAAISTLSGYTGLQSNANANGIGYNLQYKVVGTTVDQSVLVNRPSIVFILRDVSILSGVPQISYEFKTATSGAPDPSNYRTKYSNSLLLIAAAQDGTTTEATAAPNGFSLLSPFGATFRANNRTQTQSLMAAKYQTDNFNTNTLIGVDSFSISSSGSWISFIIEVKKSELATSAWRTFQNPEV